MFKFPCKVITATALLCCVAAVSRAGSYPPAAGYPGATAISASSAGFAEWATGATINRGLVQIDNPSLGFADYGGSSGTLIKNGAATISPNSAPLGEPPLPGSAYYGVALGQAGTATLTFAEPIANGPGAGLRRTSATASRTGQHLVVDQAGIRRGQFRWREFLSVSGGLFDAQRIATL